MMKEAKNVRQIEGEPRRRWFDDEYFDLIVWYDKDGSEGQYSSSSMPLSGDESIWGFQLCYDREKKPRALTWTKKYGYKHTGIDNGEHVWGTSQNAPVLVEDGLFDPGAIAKKLEAAAKELPLQISCFVLKKISEFKP